jgi:hypothetical protein
MRFMQKGWDPHAPTDRGQDDDEKGEVTNGQRLESRFGLGA